MTLVEPEKLIMMEDANEKKDGRDALGKEEIFSRAVRAGKRTYFFDVKATRRNDYYLTITESKKRYHKDGRFFYEKHKLFLYKEDFDKFFEGIKETIDFIKDSNPEEIPSETFEQKDEGKSFTNVEFEDLEQLNVSSANEVVED